jgi:hypothetical protein
LVRLAATHAKAAQCEWLHVDWDPGLATFYLDACGFRPTEAGLIHLPTLATSDVGESGPRVSDPPTS